MFRSIRWQLPLSYALIALLTATLLGTLLLSHLRNYYAAQELNYLNDNAYSMSALASYHLLNRSTPQDLQILVNSFTFLAQVHVELLTPDRQTVIAESSQFSAGEPASIQWSSPIEMGTTQAADAAFNITVFQPNNDVPFPCMDMPPNQNDCAFLFTDEVERATIGRRTDVFMTAAIPSPYGFELELDARPAVLSPRSDQVVEQRIYDPNQAVIGWIRLSAGPAYGSDIVNSVASGFLLASSAAIVMAIMAGWAISHNMSTPLLALADTTARMAHGDLAARVRIQRIDEFGTLAQGFNTMAGRVEEMILTLRRFVADAAHELNTPLTALHTNLELIAAQTISPHAQTLLERAQSQLQRLEDLTHSLLQLSRLESGSGRETITTINLTQLTHETTASFASQAEQAEVMIDIHVPDTPIHLLGDASQLRSALANLIDNAIKFTPAGGTVWVVLQQTERRIEIKVRDTGIGIPPADLPYLFERFYRGHNTSEYAGNGLGLAIVQAVAVRYGGQIQVLPLLQGTEFALQFPLQAA